MNPVYHSQSSVARWGGQVDDYLPLHQYLDATKEMFADFRHRALRHHSHGIYELEREFGASITNSDGKEVPVRLIGEQHVKEDCGGFIPTVADWLKHLMPQSWMNKGYREKE